MKKFHVLTNTDKDPELKISGRISDYLKSKGCTCTVQTDIYDNREFIPDDSECVIVLGGDGTMIRVADHIRGRKPIIGVNLGTLGFLQEVEASDVEEMLDRLINDEYKIERRMMLKGNDRVALNDIVVSRKGSLKILYLNIYVNDMLLCNYKADGIVISTPTGSTAYNLSAGGPIVEPCAEAILITPICPHNLGARTIVLSPEDTVKIEVVPGRCEAEATFDGGAEIPLGGGDVIEIAKADIYTDILKLGKENFIEVLSRKMND